MVLTHMFKYMLQTNKKKKQHIMGKKNIWTLLKRPSLTCMNSYAGPSLCWLEVYNIIYIYINVCYQ